jgi:hypothetical protein
MRWLRKHGRWGSTLALLALTLQLALSFGHFHAEHAAPSVVAVTGQAGDAPQHHDDEPGCAICAVLAMLGNGATSSAPAVAAPTLLARSVLRPADETLGPLARSTSFRSRAPPFA